MSSRFQEIYANEKWVDLNIFDGRFSIVSDKLIMEFQEQMKLLKQEQAIKSVSEEQTEEQPTVEENTGIDLTEGVLSAPQIRVSSSDFVIDMADNPQITFLETDNSGGKFNFSEITFTYNIENVSVEVKENFGNLNDVDNRETLSVEDGATQISELMELYSDRNMHISVTNEKGESESLMQYINHNSGSGDYPVIKASQNENVPEFAEARTCTVAEYNALLEKASQNVPDGKPAKLHFKILLSEKTSYGDMFILTENTKKLSDILNNSASSHKHDKNFLKALKMVFDKENSTAANADSDDENSSEKRTDSANYRRKILDDFAEKYGLERISIWRKGGNTASYRIAEIKDGKKSFNEQLCTLEKGETLSEEKLLKSLEEFENSDFFVQYQQKKSGNTTETAEKSENEQEYPFVSVKAGWNYDKYISPELEEKNYTVPEFNEALRRLNERWNGEEYETKSAFVTLTIHISETESFEKKLNAEYQFGSLSECLEYETDWLDNETELRKAVKEAENKSTSPELTEKESPIHFGLLGNGITAYDISRMDKETDDYVTVAHISPEGVVKIYDDNISEKDMLLIQQEADSARKKFLTDWEKLDTVSQFQKLYDRADIETTLNIGKENLSTEEKIAKYMPFVFFGEGERPQPVIEKKPENIEISADSEPVPNNIKEELEKNIDKFYINYDNESVTWAYFNPDRDNGGQLVYNTFGFDTLESAVKSSDMLDYLTENGNITLCDVTDDDFTNSAAEFLQPDEDFNSEGLSNAEIEEKLSAIIETNQSLNKNIYRIVTYSKDSGADDKEEYATMDEAVEEGRQYLYDGYDGFAILNTEENKVDLYEGDFPLEGIFSEQVYKNSGNWQRAEPIPNLLFDKFNEHYNEMYENHDEVNGYDEAVAAGDKFIRENPDIMGRIANSRNDIISGDRETAALAFALADVGMIDKFVETEQPEQYTAKKLYRQFAELFPDIVSGEHIHERYGNISDALEPLSVEHLGGNRYAFMTYFIQNGDLMRDPDFEFELDHKNKTLNILAYQQDGSIFGTIYQRVYDENDNPDLKLLSALEENFMLNLDNVRNTARLLTSFTDKDGNKSDENIEPEEPEYDDKSPELREVLNEFSIKYGLGELNIEPGNYNWKLSEKFADDTEFPLGELDYSEYGKPFTPDELRTALEKFEKTAERRNQNISEIYDRKSFAENHGISRLPKVQKNLPEISYASRPSEKIRDNISAIREMIRLENAEKSGEELYDKRSNQYNSRQASERRLRQYSGWGGLSQVFDERFKQYRYDRQELQSLLTPEEYAAAKASALNAHYTPQIIIDLMYKAVQNMDLPRNARILEPSCGTGNFISRLPGSFGEAEITGVEIDGITARIARQINRGNKNVEIINSGFENTNLANNSFDLAIGNVPFGDYNMNDPDYVQDWRIHDAFFRKALDKVAPGGVVAFVTSTGTMDKSSPKVREYLAAQAELVGAVRLPNNAFSGAGTSVSSDIIFLKKREIPLQKDEPKPDWCYTIPDKNGLKINSYFVQNPQMLLGEMKKTTFQDRLTCEPFEGADLEKQLAEAIKNLNAKITVARREKVISEQRGRIEPWGKNFTFQLKDDKIYYRNGEKMDEIKCTQTEKEMIEKLCGIRDTARKLIDLQKTSIPDSELVSVRDELNKLYDEYKSEYGELSDKSVKKLFGNDSDYPILQSLENYNKATGATEKADIFFRRTVNPMLEIKSAESVEEALQVSLDRKGKPDILYMSVLLNQPSEQICNELLEKGQIFIDPEKELPDKPFSGVTERSEYLSGNVRMKLTIAEIYAKTNAEYSRNVEALKTVIPEDIKAEEISAQMGCAWIEPQDYTQFLEHLSGRASYNSRRCDVSYSTATGEFSVFNAGSKQTLNLNETTTYGTADYNMYQLAEKILNQRRIVVKREKVNPKDPSKTVTRTDPTATKIANEKAKLIREEFQKWIFADPARKERYEQKYNYIFNSIVGRDYDGSHLTFSGMNNNFTLRPHQKNCVARAIYGGNTLAAHVVGAGKSAVIFASVMKKKELGLINKACVVVPKALTEQTASEWRRVYPDAKILTVTNDDLSNETKRNLFTAKVATGSYDAVILSQEQFEKIPMSNQYRINFMQKELDNLEDMLREKKLENSGKRDYSINAIESAKKRLQVKLEKLLDPKSASKAKDSLLEFEQLGFDYLVVDEAHAYKNGFVTTKMNNVSGVTTRPSGRAEDMQMKTDYFNEQLGQGHILFCTGTPVSNSMTELYVMTRYLRPDLLKQAGVERFDDWAATFGKVVTKNQQTAAGTLKMKTSFANFVNLPELMAMYKEFADVQNAEKLNLPRPELKTGKPQIISVPATPEQKEYVCELADRAKAIEDGLVEPYEDNHLKLTTEAKLIGLGNKAVKALYEKRGEDLPYDFIDDKNSKVDKCIEKVAEIYEKTNDTKGVQIIFSDVAVNSDNGNFSVYEYIKSELVAKGIPEDEIIFAPKSDSKERENIFRDINNSKYRIVIASTSTLGTGANIQQNLYALHHIDIPLRPSDFEQREGRILRQGNKNKEVEIFNYVTEGTLDSYLYQTVTNKARFIAQLLDNKTPARVSEDCDEKVLMFKEYQAAAEGNPDLKRFIELSSEIAELDMFKNEYAHETALTREKVERIPAEIELKKEMLSHIQNDKKSAEKIKEITLSNPVKSSNFVVMTREKVNEYLLKMAQEKLANHDKEIPKMNINNFEVSVHFDPFNNEVRFQVKGEHTYSCIAGTAKNQDNYQRISNLFEKMIPKKEQEIMKEISALEENLEQAKKRIEIPFAQESELADKIDEYQKLESKLAELSAQEDIIFDPEEEPIIETAEEKSAREKIYNVDENDYPPTDNDTNFNRPKH